MAFSYQQPKAASGRAVGAVTREAQATDPLSESRRLVRDRGDEGGVDHACSDLKGSGHTGTYLLAHIKMSRSNPPRHQKDLVDIHVPEAGDRPTECTACAMCNCLCG